MALMPMFWGFDAMASTIMFEMVDMTNSYKRILEKKLLLE